MLWDGGSRSFMWCYEHRHACCILMGLFIQRSFSFLNIFFGNQPDWNLMCSKSLERVKNPILSFWLLSNDTKPTCCYPLLLLFFLLNRKSSNCWYYFPAWLVAESPNKAPGLGVLTSATLHCFNWQLQITSDMWWTHPTREKVEKSKKNRTRLC